MFYYWNYLLLLVSGLLLPFARGQQPRFLATALVLTAILGLALLQYHLWTIPEAWYILSALYFLMNLMVLAVSPAQLLLLLFVEPRDKPQAGIVVHHGGTPEEEIIADIVAVHGLGSNPAWAWSYEGKDGTRCMWLEDLLPKDLPNTRIMSFNHNSKWDLDASVKSIDDCGQELIDNLNLCRKAPEEESRKIIFIGHSFGGIIIKQALVIASRVTHDTKTRHQSLRDSAASTIFLGVPHDGSTLTQAGKLMSYATYWLGSSTQLLEALEPRSKLLRELNNSFLSVFKGGKIVNFCERHKTKKWGIPLLLAVDEASGSSPGIRKIGLDADHVGMNKFKSREDNNYKLVLREIQSVVEDMRGYTEAEAEASIKSLLFNGIDDREHLITKNHESTFKWIWTHEEFLVWKNKKPRIFWVKGKAGSGKSTLLKYVLNKMKKREPHSIFTRYFFNDRGGELAKGFKGFLQATLNQILFQIPTLCRYFTPLYKERLSRFGEEFDWPVQILSECLISVLNDDSAKSIHIFIDALDECEPISRNLMLEFLADICDIGNSDLKIFVTSRNEGRIILTMETIRKLGKLESFGSIKIDEWTRDDMEKYIASQVTKLPEFCQDLIEKELLSRAQGVFLWVRLVVYDLLQYASDSSIAEIKTALDAIPDELDDLYRRMLMKVKRGHLPETEAMLRWATFAKRPLTLGEFRYALAVNIDRFSSIEELGDSESVVGLTQMRNRVQNYSGGLLEVVVKGDADERHLVQIIHQSAREFLTSKSRMIGDFEMQLTQSTSNLYIIGTCLSYLNLPEPPTFEVYSSDWEPPSFLEYVGRYWAEHFRDTSAGISDPEYGNYFSKSPITDISDTKPKEEMDIKIHREAMRAYEFLFTKSTHDWRKTFHNGFNPIRVAYEEGFHQIIKIAIEKNSELSMPNFDLILLDEAIYFGHAESLQFFLENKKDLSALRLQSNRYWGALYTAASKDNKEIVRLLLNHKSRVDADLGECSKALYMAKIEHRNKIVQLLLENGVNLKLLPKESPYLGAVHRYLFSREYSIVKFLVENGADINPQYCPGASDPEAINLPHKPCASLLQTAVYLNTQKGIVKFLIDSGADVNAQGGMYGSALSIAVRNGNPELIQCLMENGADIDVHSYMYGDALRNAVNHGNLKLVQLLVQSGGDFDAHDPCYGSILQRAIFWGRNDIVRFFVKKGVGINAHGGHYGSALHAAVHRGSEEIVEFLLESGADLKPQNEHGNALQMAIQLARYDIARTLVEKGGAEINAQGGKYGNALSIAISRGNQVELVDLLVKNGANIDVNSCDYGNALQRAIFLGHDDTVKFLVSKGANVNAQGGHYGSPLRAAVQRGDEKMLQFLLGNGADINAQSDYHGNILQQAILLDRHDLAKFLVKKGVKINAHGSHYGSALHVAVQRGSKEMIKFLLDNDADINAHGGSYGRALQVGVCYHEELVGFLVRSGADVNGHGGYCGNALQAAAAMGKLETVEFLFEMGADTNAQGGHFENALLAAVYHGHKGIVNFLIRGGADIHKEHSKYGNPLQVASFRGHLEIVKLLVQNGANLNDHGGYYGNALQAAATEASEIVRYLITNGVDVNSQGGFYGNALQAAASRGHAETVQLLLENEAIVNAQGGEYGNALQAASTKHLKIVKFLIENGANVRLKGGKYGGALQAAAYHQNWDIVRYLVENGADVNAGGSYGNALQIAASRGDEKTVSFLIENGADINAQDGFYGNALQAAATGSLNVVKILYKEGVDVNIQGGYYGNALQAAAHRGDEWIVPFLVGKKANVNGQGGRYGNALQAAAQRGRRRIVDFLIYKVKVDINIQGGYYNTALQAACTAVRDRGIVELLVREGAEINAQGGKYNTALQAAATRKLEIVRFLIRNGADINAQGGYYGNALQAAATRSLDIVEFLVQNGADVNAQGGYYGNALQAAATRDLQIVRFLIQNGASPNTKGGYYGNALQAAKAKEKTSIVELLIHHGAKWRLENTDNNPTEVLLTSNQA